MIGLARAFFFRPIRGLADFFNLPPTARAVGYFLAATPWLVVIHG
jgi:hypothetical protein